MLTALNVDDDYLDKLDLFIERKVTMSKFKRKKSSRGGWWILAVFGITSLAVIALTSYAMAHTNHNKASLSAPSAVATSVPSPKTLSPIPTTTSTPSATPAPTEPPECEADRIAIQKASGLYYAAHGSWPTADGKPGMIKWDMLVPDYLNALPTTTACKWQVSSNPEGQLCRSANC